MKLSPHFVACVLVGFIAGCSSSSSMQGDNDAGSLDGGDDLSELDLAISVQLTPAAVTLTLGQLPFTFAASGGDAPYSFAVTAGPGSIGIDGTFVPDGIGASVVTATDAIGRTATAAIETLSHVVEAEREIFAIDHFGGSVYIGGEFHIVNPHHAPQMIALDLAGTPKPACNLKTGFDAPVQAFVVIGDALFVGGEFSHYRGQPAERLAKLDVATCELDTSFSAAVADNGFDDAVYALATAGGALYVGGAFTTYRGIASSAIHLAKLDPTSGALDTTFSPAGANGFDADVWALEVAGGALYAGGNFTSYRGVPDSARRVAKLDLASGAIDTIFSPVGATANGVDGVVFALTSAGGALYVGGNFTAYRGGVDSARRIAKLDLSSGAIDTTFSPPGAASNGFSGTVYALTSAGNSLYAGGNFSRYRGVLDSALGLAKLDLSTGVLDTTFSPPGNGANGFTGSPEVGALCAVGGALYVGGDLRGYRGVVGAVRDIAKLDLATGALDTSFVAEQNSALGFDDPPLAIIAVGSTLFMGGYMTQYGGYTAHNLAKLDAITLRLDTTFSPPAQNGVNSQVYALAHSATALYVGGFFTAYQGVADSARRLAKLDPATGAIDTIFSPVGATTNGFDFAVESLLVDGTSLYVGGAFSAYRGVAESARRIAKLDATNGALDTTFSPPGAPNNGFDATVRTLALAGGSLYAGGDLTAYRGVADSTRRIAKLDPTTGVLDTVFSPPGALANGFDASVWTLASAGTSLYAGGEFTAYKGVADSARRLAKLDLATGAIDTTFSPVGAGANGFNDDVLTLYADGTALFVGGNFTSYRGTSGQATRIAKLDGTSGVLDDVFTPLGTSSGFNAVVHAIVPVQSDLFVGGFFAVYRDLKVQSLVAIDSMTGAPR